MVSYLLSMCSVLCPTVLCSTALSGSLALSLQSLFYLAGNLGYQFGAFGNLPFVSEGLVSITGSAVMAGLVLSAYRFDTVLKEKD